MYPRVKQTKNKNKNKNKTKQNPSEERYSKFSDVNSDLNKINFQSA